MVKPKIDRPALSPAAVREICAQYGLNEGDAAPTLTSLAGGFSGTNYRVDFASGARCCLKVCHGYSRAFVESQSRVQAHLRSSGFALACFAIPLAGASECDEFQYASIDPDTGIRASL